MNTGADDQATDNAQAPEGEGPAESTATGAASTQQADPYEAKFAALTAQTERALKAAENAARFTHQRDTEIAQLRRENAQYRQSTQTYSDDSQTSAPPAQDPNLMARLHLMEFKQLHPDWRERLQEMQEVSSDAVFAERFGGDLSSRVTFEAAYEAAENRKLRAELAELRAVKEKTDQAKKAVKDQAFVSGQGAVPQQSVIDRAALDKMTPEEMEKKFGKDVLARGYF